MATTLASLTNRLQADAPATGDGVPTAEQYELAVTEAVEDVSARAPLRQHATLAVVAGTATYDLPADFRRLVRLESCATPDGVIISPTGLIPVGAGYQERFVIAGGQITFIPAPTAGATRGLWYAAAYILDGSDSYPTMTPDVARLVLLRARATVLGWQAAAAAPVAISWSIGDESMSKSGVAREYRAAQESAQRDYEAALRAHIGAIGLRGSPPPGWDER